MKHMKKLVGLLMTFIMVFAMTAMVFAADTTYSISVPDADDHTYSIYQIFTGDLNHDGTILSNVKWGLNGTNTAGAVVSDEILDELESVAASTSDTEKLAVIKKYANLEGTPFAAASKGNPVSVPAGYYLIKDSAPITGQDTATLYIVKIVEDQEINRKADVPKSQKKVQDKNDTDGIADDWQDAGDWDIGDKVPFQLKATLGSDYDNYKVYKLTFHDHQSPGLTFDPANVKVYVDGVNITEGFEVVTEGLTDGCTFEVRFADTKKIESIGAGSVITVEYESLLNANAVIGPVGNPNVSHITFSNNPNDDQGGENGSTPDDKVIVFTYQVIISKIDLEGKPLAGAEFTLEKQIKGENGAEDTWKEITAIKDETGTVFTFKGLDDGTYRLRETKTPDGYNTIDPITFKIIASHEIESDDPKFMFLGGSVLTQNVPFFKLEGNQEEGAITADVVNKAGVEFPETGGMGTTIFYVLGAILVLGSVVALIVKKRMR